MHCIVGLCLWLPPQTQAPNGLSSPPCWGRFFELSFYKGRRLEWSVLSRFLPAGLAHAQLQTLQCRSPRRILLEFLGGVPSISRTICSAGGEMNSLRRKRFKEKPATVARRVPPESAASPWPARCEILGMHRYSNGYDPHPNSWMGNGGQLW